MAELFGFKIERLKGPSTDPRQNIVPPAAEDGTQVVPAGGFFASYGGFDVTARNELDLIRRYMRVINKLDYFVETLGEMIVKDPELKIEHKKEWNYFYNSINQN